MSHSIVAPPVARRYGGRAVLVALLTLLAVLLSPTAAGAAPPTAPLTTDPADAAAGWLTGEFVDGNHFAAEFDLDGNGIIDPATEVFPDHGLTADAVLAFAAAGSAGTIAVAATDWLATQVGAYTGSDFGESYAGSLAKLILVADIMGRDPATFGATDLISALQAREAASGRYSDLSSADFSNGITQALAIIALDRATPGGPPTAAVDYLLAQQCADGGFNSVLEQVGCVGEVDTTAFALEALSVAGRTAEAGDARDFLLAQQAGDGSFAAPGFGTPPVTSPNANSTGLAAQALRFAGETAAADAAAAWLLSLQVGLTGPVADQGAIAYDTAGFDRGNGIRATTQALLGLVGSGFSALQAPADPAAYGLGAAAVPPPTGGGAVPPAAIPPIAVPPAAVPPVAVSAELAATGTAPAGLVGVGGGLLALGSALVLVSGRRTRTEF